MKNILFASITFIVGFQSNLYSQTQQSSPTLYAHKVMVDSIIQTKAYSYLKVTERIKDKDSLQWLALPVIEAKAGDIFYFNSGLQMGEFHSRELDRNFNQILFLPNLSTSAEVSDKTIVPKPAIDTIRHNTTPLVVHTVVVKEVIQTSGYTYLRVLEGDKEEWLAIVRRPVKVGQTYTFDQSGTMTDFASRELNRTFKEILLVAKLTLVTEQESATHPKKITPIGKLLKNKNSYEGKLVKIKGKVTKYSADILGKNWIHIEDETDYSGKYDLSATINQEVKVGDTIIIEGKISLDKDFGSGYFFEILMEDAKIQIK